MTVLGIDVSKATLDCALLDRSDRSHRVLWQTRVSNTAAGIEQLLSRTPAGTCLVLEPTGRYGRALVEQASHSGRHEVLLAPTRRAKAFRQSINSRAKTDRIDSRCLALFALAQPVSKPLRPYPIKSDVVEEVDQLLSARKGISHALTSLEKQRQELPHAAVCLEAAITSLKQQKAALDKQIAQRVKEADVRQPGSTLSATAERLQSVPGIGPITAAAVASRLEHKHFPRPDHFVSYIGLDVDVRQSGKRRGNNGLSKQGDAELRRLLYLAAQANLRSKDPSNPFKLQYERERKKGLPTTAALCAVARKLAKLCWSLHKYQSAYDPQRVAAQGGQMPKKQGHISSQI